jgi:hypothetical protein
MLVQVLMAIAASVGIATSATTTHADLAHQGQAVNAHVMVGVVEECLNSDGDDPCEEMYVYVCAQHAGESSPHAKVICKNGDHGDGLIIGLRNNNPVVVTGYRARWSYWRKSFFRDRCVVISIDFLRGFFNMMFPGALQ